MATLTEINAAVACNKLMTKFLFFFFFSFLLFVLVLFIATNGHISLSCLLWQLLARWLAGRQAGRQLLYGPHKWHVRSLALVFVFLSYFYFRFMWQQIVAFIIQPIFFFFFFLCCFFKKCAQNFFLFRLVWPQPLH